MTARHQAATHRCDCGAVLLVTRQSAHEFRAACDACKRTYGLSWAHKLPPPTFGGDIEPRLPLQADLHPADCLCDACAAARLERP